MRKYFLLPIIFLAACASMLPNIEDQHPTGYSILVRIAPECTNIDIDNHGACLASAKILESKSPQDATLLFLAHWEESIFSSMERTQSAGEDWIDARTLSGAAVRNYEAKAMNKIAIPVLKATYENANNKYARTMIQQADMIQPLSRSSFDTFREVHTRLVPTIP